MMISSYILKMHLSKKLKDYFYVKNNIQQTVYLNDIGHYKPLYDNKLVQILMKRLTMKIKRILEMDQPSDMKMYHQLIIDVAYAQL